MKNTISLRLVEKAAKGNKEDFGELIIMHQEYLYKLAYMYTKNEQDTLVLHHNDSGAGLYQIVKTKFEITVEEKCSKERTASGVFMTVLDADGKLLPHGGSSFADNYAINGRDVSRVYVYVCDYAEYMDDIKGRRNDTDFKEILEERALYGKEIVF